eukprot:4253330-Pyramimonas_sp.AAC.1
MIRAIEQARRGRRPSPRSSRCELMRNSGKWQTGPRPLRWPRNKLRHSSRPLRRWPGAPFGELARPSRSR